MPDGHPHVLLVDDEPDYLAVVETLLVNDGLDVATAPDGWEAVGKVRDGLRPQLVLLDQRMPRLSGVETLRHLRRAGLSVPAVLVSAIQDVHETAVNAGFHGSLRKPFEFDDLRTLIRDLLPKSGGSDRG